MPSEEAKKVALRILKESGDKYNKDFIVVDKYDPDTILVVLDSMVDIINRAKGVIEENQLPNPLDAIDFCGMVTDILMHSCTRNIQSFAMLKRIVANRD